MHPRKPIGRSLPYGTYVLAGFHDTYIGPQRTDSGEPRGPVSIIGYVVVAEEHIDVLAMELADGWKHLCGGAEIL
jgi:hypothetical protein